MGANVVSGSGLGVVIRLGKDSYLGHIAQTLEQVKGKTNFELGLAKITKTMIRYMIFVVAGVFLINGFYKKDWLSAFMFSISVAVGITPGMLPMIVNATLSKGAQFLAKKKTIVKNISAIQNLGAIDVLCTDKTGTLTEDAIVLHQYMDVHGNDEREILDYAYLNSYFSTGIKNLIDRAILKYGETHGVQEDVSRYRKIDEIPFDYTRKRMSVVIENGEGKHRLNTKGALEEIVKICASVRIEGKDEPLEESHLKEVQEHADDLNREGMHVIAIAEKHVQIDVKTFSPSDEEGLTFLGYAAFLDPPKSDVGNAIQGLLSAGVDIKVISGDAPLVVEHIAREVGIPAGETLLGEYIEQLSEEDLRAKVETARIFARVSPLEKQRIVDALKVNGHVVGYMGDGVNDAPSIRHADVGISVDNATDVAKESADIILLEKSLTVLLDGIFEGRRVYGNVVKYMKMALSSNFGNVFSVLAASLLLPFLPMIPIQILIQNLIYDGTQIAIPWDRVDEEFLKTPKKWDTASLSRFMNVMGAVSSFFDLVIFGILWFVLGYATISQQTLFQTGWFIEGLISQTLIVHFIRTSKISFLQSRADIRLLLSSALGILAALLIPVAMHQITSFHFEIMPPGFYGYLLLTLTSYAIVIELVKKLYIRRTGGWL
jgi:Mg2+-importing ATPase